MTLISEMAGFYWELYSELIQLGFDEQQAMKIILKEAKIPRQKTVKEVKNMREVIEDVIKKHYSKDDTS